jgi:hypothetical protein
MTKKKNKTIGIKKAPKIHLQGPLPGMVNIPGVFCIHTQPHNHADTLITPTHTTRHLQLCLCLYKKISVKNSVECLLCQWPALTRWALSLFQLHLGRLSGAPALIKRGRLWRQGSRSHAVHQHCQRSSGHLAPWQPGRLINRERERERGVSKCIAPLPRGKGSRWRYDYYSFNRGHSLAIGVVAVVAI